MPVTAFLRVDKKYIELFDPDRKSGVGQNERSDQ